MKKLLILLVALTVITAKAQTQNNADSLLVVKNYIEEIQTTVNSKLKPKEKVAVMDSLIHLGSPYQHVLEKHLAAFATAKETEDIITSYKFIVGSLIMYKTDIKEGGYEEPATKPNEDINYINTRVPELAGTFMMYINRTHQPAKKE